MKMPPKSRRTHAKSLRAICKRLKLPFHKTASSSPPASEPPPARTLARRRHAGQPLGRDDQDREAARLTCRDNHELPVCHEARHARGFVVARGEGGQRIRQAGAWGLRLGGGRKGQ